MPTKNSLLVAHLNYNYSLIQITSELFRFSLSRFIIFSTRNLRIRTCCGPQLADRTVGRIFAWVGTSCRRRFRTYPKFLSHSSNHLKIELVLWNPLEAHFLLIEVQLYFSWSVLALPQIFSAHLRLLMAWNYLWSYSLPLGALFSQLWPSFRFFFREPAVFNRNLQRSHWWKPNDALIGGFLSF